ncbi:MAG: type I restriction-modification enzyme R subunit C-terminal domain-containing protein [Limnochordia bacterium]|jgi:type I restriction enzyme R subunit
MGSNQHPEQRARDRIDHLLTEAGWQLQSRDSVNVYSSLGVAVRELHTTEGPADYVLFVDSQPVGVIEAKKEEEGFRLTVHEDQTEGYRTSTIKLLDHSKPLRFGYESTGELTRFTDYHDPKPRSRPVFAFHRPETLRRWISEPKTLRARLHDLPTLDPEGLRKCQFRGINNLDVSFRDAKPRALIQMATGAGKTYTAITFIYRLLKFAKARRVLFLVDTLNLGEQAEQAFMAYEPKDDNRMFTDLYKVQRLTSRYIAPDSNVCISTIQRMYSILKGEELDPADEETHPAERVLPAGPLPVVYNDTVPPEHFDFIVIDECHRSIYNVWQQVLEYFDAFQIGLTATPDKRTFAYFHENVVSEYPYEQSVADGVNVGYDIYRIETRITQSGGVIKSDGGFVVVRDKLTRRQGWQEPDEDITYTGKQLDRDVVNPSQIRTIIRTFKERLPELFPGRKEAPKTLIFAKDDSHADDIVQIVREEFGEGNAFCKKITYRADDPKGNLIELRNNYNPRIAVTVDMIATGTDVKPLECLIFMRDVRSRSYFEQMKGRGCRTIDPDDLKKVSPSAALGKSHFIVVDAVGVTTSLKTDSRPLERKPRVPFKDLVDAIALGRIDEDTFVSVAGRLAKLNMQITPKQRKEYVELSGGKSIEDLTSGLLKAHDPDTIEQVARERFNLGPNVEPTEEQRDEAQRELAREVAKTLTPQVRQFLESARKAVEQIIDNRNIDEVTDEGWDKESVVNAEQVIADFRAYLEQHKDEITALRIFYDQPYRLRELTLDMVKEVLDRLKADQPALAPVRIWNAYTQLEENVPTCPKNELVALVSLLRRIVGLDQKLTSFEAVARQRFQDWVFTRHHGDAPKFTEEQMHWLHMVRDHIVTSFHITADDLELAPFNGQGGLGRFYQLFGGEYEEILEELNEVLVA